ncbi:hypothetical protein G4Z05_00430 [Bacillus thermocopriae]|uniref:DUF4376 domain-containing protein n=1 Tax=Neobacillus thermocopriae TaxID=1215031 RepID=A0A6B3TM30_9BACI|nr:hypothetical protein [Neobacillus thermocopriae]NEX77369.1 hypothetical protein [Neobacillus thermocopriae]
MIQVWEVDSDGNIVEHYLMTQKQIDVARKEGKILIEFPWGEGFYSPKFDLENNKWIESDLESVLNQLKQEKFAELSQACREDILGYFKATVNGIEYEFSFDAEAQDNFTETLVLFTSNIIAEQEWTAWKDGQPVRIMLDKDSFMRVIQKAYGHKNSKIAKLRNELQPILESCTTIEEIKSITWN